MSFSPSKLQKLFWSGKNRRQVGHSFISSSSSAPHDYTVVRLQLSAVSCRRRIDRSNRGSDSLIASLKTSQPSLEGLMPVTRVKQSGLRLSPGRIADACAL